MLRHKAAELGRAGVGIICQTWPKPRPAGLGVDIKIPPDKLYIRWCMDCSLTSNVTGVLT